jgi:hypothetical protein
MKAMPEVHITIVSGIFVVAMAFSDLPRGDWIL